jgi:KUP system potassium uptake protein
MMSKIGKSVCSKVTTALLLVALGIIYGDIGTSPLYALHAVVGEREITKKFVDDEWRQEVQCKS